MNTGPSEPGSSSNNDFNKVVRMTRISKLYKLIKITRLIRLLKLMKKQNNQVIDKLGQSLQISQGFERLSFFFLILLLLCHFVCCLWIFVARNFQDETQDSDTWIKAGGYEEYSIFDLYVTSYYFTVTTITTVGYGDISGNSSIERVICFFLHLIGVLTYSFASGSLTSIIANYDSYNEQNADKLTVLNRLHKENQINAELYNQL